MHSVTKINMSGLDIRLCIFSLLLSIWILRVNSAIFINCRQPGQIALTFDDGPHPKNTPLLLSLLAEHNLKVTFFYIGPNKYVPEPGYEAPFDWRGSMEGYAKLVRRAYKEGHQIGNHSWGHRNLVDLTDAEIYREIGYQARLIHAIIGRNMTIFRAPYGQKDARVMRILKEFQYDYIHVNIDPADWSKPRAGGDEGLLPYFEAVEGNEQSSFISVNHEYTSAIVDVTNKTIQFLLKKNMKIVTISECIGAPMYG